ncbi:MAG: ATP-binding protein [Mariprofundaceae bacterium]
MRLFWKLFLILSLTLIGVAVASTWTSRLWLAETQQIEKRLDMLVGHAGTAADLYAEAGPAALRRWLHRSMRRQHFQGFLLAADGQNLLGRRLPPQVRDRIREAVGSHKRLRLVQPPHLMVIEPVAARHGNYYWAAMTRIPPRAMRESQQYQLLIRALVGLVAVLLVSGLLTRMLIRPIRQLQRSAAHLGGGDMSARAADAVAGRGDELGELARSFNAMAEKLDALLNSHKQLLRDVSHELRSPLARLTVALELARNAAGDKAADELDRIAREAGQLNELIEEVLSLARFEQGVIRADKTAVNLNALLRDIVADADFEAETSGKSVVLNASSGCSLSGDRLWLGRALENVIRNAIRHTAAATTVEITMTCHSRQAEICVRDHGSGVDKAQLPHLFDAFFRVEEARERSKGGYGLGLAIARKAILSHGGDIIATNADDGGLCVLITLPLS